MGVTDTSAAKKCAECGKEFVVLYQDLWRYKRGEKWLCSWKCLRAYDKSKEGSSLREVTLEDKKKAVQIAIDGGDPREYLGKLCKAPDAMWSAIRKALKDSDPEAYAKLPRSIKGTKKEVPEPHKEEEAEEMDEDFFPAGEDVKEPTTPSDITISAIRHKKFGEFYHDFDHNCVDWRTPEGEEVSMSIPGIVELYKIFPAIMKQLEVEL